MAKTIFITGASRGLGRIWAEAFLDRGDHVVVTSRNIGSLSELSTKYGSAVLPLELDISSKAACVQAIARAKAHFGSVDVVINNAGTGVIGMVEELAEQDVRTIMEANFFGTLWVTQAALPVMREQGHGHILQLSSALGIYTFPTLGIYSASKFAIEGLSEALAMEVKSLGIHVTLVEPNGFATDFIASSVNSEPIAAYDKTRAELYADPNITAPDAYGNPLATTAAILQLVDSPRPPLRLILGKKALPLAQAAYKERLASWEEYKEISIAAHG